MVVKSLKFMLSSSCSGRQEALLSHSRQKACVDPPWQVLLSTVPYRRPRPIGHPQQLS